MVMSLIESLTRIRNSVYGREVREAIHDGVFRANQIADKADAKSDETQIRQDVVEDQFDAVQRTATETADWGGEIIVASDGELTLQNRLERDLATTERKFNQMAINVNDFGAKGDFDPVTKIGTDDTDAIKAAILATPVGQKLIFPNPHYKFSEPLLAKDINIDMDTSILWYAGSTGTAFTMGDDTGYFKTNSTINVRKIAQDWVADTVGIEIINSSYNTISFSAWGFKLGVAIVGDKHGNVYNKYYPGHLYNNKKSLLIRAKNDGWSNENTFFSGSMGWTSDMPVTSEDAHLHIENDGYANNNNKFYGMSFEDGKGGNGIGHAAIIEGNYNALHDCRYEGAFKVHFGDLSNYNYIANGYGLEMENMSGRVSAQTIMTHSQTQLVSNQAKAPLILQNTASSINKGIIIKNANGVDVFNVDGYGNIRTAGNRGLYTGATDPEGTVSASFGAIFANQTTGDLFHKRLGLNTNTGWKPIAKVYAESTANRPPKPTVGEMAFDITLKKPIWWSGTTWLDASGMSV